MIEVHLEPFLFPNFLRVREWREHNFSVAMLTDEQAGAYWDELREKWIEHVREKRLANQEWLRNEAEMKSRGKP